MFALSDRCLRWRKQQRVARRRLFESKHLFDGPFPVDRRSAQQARSSHPMPHLSGGRGRSPVSHVLSG